MVLSLPRRDTVSSCICCFLTRTKIDLSDAHFAVDAGIGALRELKAQGGARIVSARPYLALQLAGRGRPDRRLAVMRTRDGLLE